MDTNSAFPEAKVATLAIMNYESASIELVSLNQSVLDEYADDYDKFVYDVMGYKRESVYYMISKSIVVIDNR